MFWRRAISRVTQPITLNAAADGFLASFVLRDPWLRQVAGFCYAGVAGRPSP